MDKDIHLDKNKYMNLDIRKRFRIYLKFSFTTSFYKIVVTQYLMHHNIYLNEKRKSNDRSYHNYHENVRKTKKEKEYFFSDCIFFWVVVLTTTHILISSPKNELLSKTRGDRTFFPS